MGILEIEISNHLAECSSDPKVTILDLDGWCCHADWLLVGVEDWHAMTS
jgi:hypothetical protein